MKWCEPFTVSVIDVEVVVGEAAEEEQEFEGAADPPARPPPWPLQGFGTAIIFTAGIFLFL